MLDALRPRLTMYLKRLRTTARSKNLPEEVYLRIVRCQECFRKKFKLYYTTHRRIIAGEVSYHKRYHYIACSSCQYRDWHRDVVALGITRNILSQLNSFSMVPPNSSVGLSLSLVGTPTAKELELTFPNLRFLSPEAAVAEVGRA